MSRCNRRSYMPGQRNESQTVEAFSAPRELIRDAQLEAKRRRMSKSGFYRYCLAKELGRNEEQAQRIAEHAAIGNFQVINAGTVQKIETNFPSASGVHARKAVKGRKGKRGKGKADK